MYKWSNREEYNISIFKEGQEPKGCHVICCTIKNHVWEGGEEHHLALQ